jgi:translation initiation factor 1A
MPKNAKKQKNTKVSNVEREKRNLLLKTDFQEYAKAVKMMGGGRIDCHCFDNKNRLGIIRGKLQGRGKKKGFISVDDIILVAFRSFEDDKVDVIHVYTPDEVKELKRRFEIPEEKQEDDGGAFYFGKDEEDIKVDNIVDIDNI